MKNRGFTLIEVMIVLALVAALVAFGVPRLFKSDNNIRKVSRQFIAMSREIRNQARLSNATYRIVFNMEDNSDKYWVERANGLQPIDPNAAEKEKDKDEEDAPPSAFKKDNFLFKKDKQLPTGLRFSSIETMNMKAPQTSGIAYIYFFPEGFVEAAAVQIAGPNNVTWTLVFNPLTGQADIIEKAQALKDIQR